MILVRTILLPALVSSVVVVVAVGSVRKKGCAGTAKAGRGTLYDKKTGDSLNDDSGSD